MDKRQERLTRNSYDSRNNRIRIQQTVKHNRHNDPIRRTGRHTKEIRVWLLALFVLLFVPLLLAKLLMGEETKSVLRAQQEELELLAGENTDTGYTVWYHTGTGTAEIPMEICLVSELATVMEGDAEPEALRAVAIVLRTQMVYEILEHGTCETQHYQSMEEWRRSWGEQAALYQENYQAAVRETAGVIAVYEGKPVPLPYHQISSGKTRDGLGDMSRLYPYLKQADCNTDLLERGYLNTISLSQKEFCRILKKLAGSTKVNDISVTIDSRDSAGYVSELTIAGSGFAAFAVGGETFREAYGLPSADFAMKETEEGIEFICCGVGHGYGMSLYYAKELAGQGMSCMDIVTYFFQNLDFMRIA